MVLAKLVRIMAWRWSSYYRSQWWPYLLAHIGITQPQWVGNRFDHLQGLRVMTNDKIFILNYQNFYHCIDDAISIEFFEKCVFKSWTVWYSRNFKELAKFQLKLGRYLKCTLLFYRLHFQLYCLEWKPSYFELGFICKGTVDYKSGSIQVMSGRRTGDKQFPELKLTQCIDANVSSSLSDLRQNARNM